MADGGGWLDARPRAHHFTTPDRPDAVPTPPPSAPPIAPRPFPPAAPLPALPPTRASLGDDLAVLDDPVVQRGFTRYSADAAGQRIADSSLRISGMHCAACAGLIESALRRVHGVLDASVSAAGERARVRWLPQHTRAAALVAAIRAAGYDATPDAALAARQARKLAHRAAVWAFFVASFCAMQVMMLATPSYVAGPGELAPDLRQLLNWGSWLLTLPVMVFSAGPFFSGAWRSLRARRIGMDVPVALGVLVTFVASSGATFAPGGVFGSEVYFDSLTMFVGFLLAGRLLALRARHRVAQVLEAALDGLPDTALRLRDDGQIETVSVQRLAPGDRVRVPVGQAFPADGRVLVGSTQADESLLTGESVPVAKPCGAAVVAGSLNRGAPVLVGVERVGADTRIEAIAALMRDAMSQRPALAGAADRWAGPFLWAVLLLAAGAAALWSVIDPARAVAVAVSVLIVTCPCALSLAAPSALLAAASALARRGVLLQRLDALDALTQVQRFYLDKTGTVTDEQLQCTGMVRLAATAGSAVAGDAGSRRARVSDAGQSDAGQSDAGRSDAGQSDAGRSDAGLWAHAATLAGWSSHPLARALVLAHAQTQAAVQAAADHPDGPDGADGPDDPEGLAGPDAPPRWRDVQETPGQGMQAIDASGRCWRLGRADPAANPAADPVADLAADLAADPAANPAAGPSHSHAATWLACDGQRLARFDFDEVLRPDARSAVASLRARGLQVVLLSGDRPERAQRMAALLGVNAVIGGATPERKLAEVAAAQAQGWRVAMVGDGINDAPVLARADVSFAMGQGALVARAQADAVIVSNRLTDLVLAHTLARRTLRVVRQNLVWAAAYNSACIPLALAGWLPPWAAGLGMASSSLLVILNALRLAR